MDYVINEFFDHKTISDFLAFYHVARSLVYKIDISHALLVNGKSEKFTYILQKNDVLSFDLLQIEENNTPPYQGDIHILYEDEDILIVEKPPFMLVHSDGNSYDTLANRVSYYYQKKHMPNAVRHIHRLDYETSGMVIFAKHFLAHSYLSWLIENHQMKKIYVCLCHNPFKDKEGEINKRIGKDRHSNKQMVVSQKKQSIGKDALTKYQVLVTKQNISLVKVEIIGGRKHQIRVHMSSIGHPLVGDKLYGNDQEKRCMLHFTEVTFIHPRTLCPFSWTSKVPF